MREQVWAATSASASRIASQAHRRGAVEIGARGGGRGRGVVVFFGGGRHDEHAGSGSPNSSATIWRIFVFSPCPISVPPVETCTVPSRINVDQRIGLVQRAPGEAMPNLTGVSAMPFAVRSRAALNVSNAGRRRRNRHSRVKPSRSAAACCCATIWP